MGFLKSTQHIQELLAVNDNDNEVYFTLTTRTVE